MDPRVEYYYDEESSNWDFRVPALTIVGGGDDTRAEAEEVDCQCSGSPRVR